MKRTQHWCMVAMVAVVTVVAACAEADDELAEPDAAAEALECAESPDLQAPWFDRFARSELPQTMVPGGDFLTVGDDEITRFGRDLQPTWELETRSGVRIDRFATTERGDVVVAGVDFDNDGALWLARYGRAGELIHERLDHKGTEDTGVAAMALTSTREVRLMRHGTEDEAPVVVAYDSIFRAQWRHVVEGPKDWAEIAVDTQGNTYLASFDFGVFTAEGEPQGELHVEAIDPDGEEKWSLTVRVVFAAGSSGFEPFEISAGDQLYVLVGGRDWGLASVLAFRPDGTLAWMRESADEPEGAMIHSIAASPCGGLYMGGRTAEPERARLWFLNEDGQEEAGADFSGLAPADGYYYRDIDRVQVSADGRLVVWGSIDYPGRPDVVEWLRAY